MWRLELATAPTCCLSETTPIDRLYSHVSGAGTLARVCSRVFSQENEVNANVLVQTSFTGLLQYICREVIDYRFYVTVILNDVLK